MIAIIVVAYLVLSLIAGLIFFCAAIMASRASEPRQIDGAHGQLPVTLASNGHAVAAAVFSLALKGLSFEPATSNGDGMPDVIQVQSKGGSGGGQL